MHALHGNSYRIGGKQVRVLELTWACTWCSQLPIQQNARGHLMRPEVQVTSDVDKAAYTVLSRQYRGSLCYSVNAPCPFD